MTPDIQQRVNDFEGGFVCHLLLLRQLFVSTRLTMIRFSGRNIGSFNTVDTSLRKYSVLLGK